VEFKSNRNFTIGVELEFQLLSPENMELVPAAPALLKKVPVNLRERIKQEFIQSMVEVTTDVCSSMDEVEEDLSSTIRILESLCQKENVVTFAASLHPYSKARDQRLSSNERYKEILDELQIVGRRLITQGLHVHVGLPDGQTAIKVFDQIRIFLPLLLALSTSSPFFQGEDTGLYSYRSKLFNALPRSGMPEPLGSWENYTKLIDLMRRAAIIKDPRDIWWDVRPHPHFGTIEIRICDLPSSMADILAITAMIHVLVIELATDSLSCPVSHRAVITNNKWNALRRSVDGKYVEPYNLRQIPTRDALLDLVERLRPASEDRGSERHLKQIKNIIKRGTSAHCQRRLYAQSGSFPEMIKAMRKEFWNIEKA